MNQKSAFLRLYLDIEGGLAFVGTGIGGVLILENGKIKPGYQITPFIAIPLNYDLAEPDKAIPLIAPFYRRCLIGGSEPIREAGVFYKVTRAVAAGDYTEYNPWIH